MWGGFSLILILCAVTEIKCWSSDNCDGCRGPEYTRNKRTKYYSIPSHKHYNRPTYGYANRGPFHSVSHGYSPNEIGPPIKPRPYKVSKRPINEGLGDEDIDKLIKYLSNKDLDKIVEFAAEKEMYPDNYRDTDNYEYSLDFKNIDYEEDSPNPNGPNIVYDYNKYNNIEYHNLNTNYLQSEAHTNNMYFQVPVNTDELEKSEHPSLLDEYFHKEINLMSSKNNIFTDSSTMGEEELPKPINLREDDYDVSFTNNIPSIAKPETAYRIENFANLPLMEYQNFKSEKVNSYSVPHYSVVSPSNPRPRLPSPQPLPPSQSSSSILSLVNVPEVEPAPPASVAKEQSDAHLKAIKIWTHRSKGTAYTLHDDGTLSLEQPARPRYKLP